MICKRILPCAELRYFIREYLVAQFVFKDQSTLPPVRAYPANPEEAIRFLIIGKLFSTNLETGKNIETPTISIIGQPTIRQNLQITHEYVMLYVRFQPGSLFKLLRIPMTMLIDQHVDATAILGNEIQEVYQQLGCCTSYEEMISLLNNYFMKKLCRLKNDSHPLNNMGRIILQNPQGFNLKKAANEACLSYRPFEKRFEKLIGVTPKYYARICRFYQAFELKEHNPNHDWLSIAVRTGYNDYQHLVKDFKEFAGTTPNVLMGENLNSPSRAFSSSSDFRGI